MELINLFLNQKKKNLLIYFIPLQVDNVYTGMSGKFAWIWKTN